MCLATCPEHTSNHDIAIWQISWPYMPIRFTFHLTDTFEATEFEIVLQESLLSDSQNIAKLNLLGKNHG